MVKFCPKCGGLMVPVKENNKNYLKCTKCGYKIEMSKGEEKRYRIGYEVEEGKHVATAKATKGMRRGLSPEEREMLQEYYEIFLESFEAEESGEGD